MARVNPLVVIDMQPDFFYELEEYWDSHVVPFVQRAANRVRKALQENRPVLLVEMAYNSSTFEEIRYELCPKWGHPETIKKKRNDGGTECLQVLDGMGLDIGHLEVLGVNWDYCVADTVMTLSERFPCKILSDSTANAFYPNTFEKQHNYVLRPPPKGDIRTVLNVRPPEGRGDTPQYRSGWARIPWEPRNVEVV